MTQRILIFDSGVGGLSIYQAIMRKCPALNICYVLDNEKFPYGELASEIIIQRCCQIVPTLVKRLRIDIAIIACNTASTYVLDKIRSLLDIPIVGVVPAVKPATSQTQNNCIGILATPATVQGAYLKQLVAQFAADKTILTLGSTTLVEQAERKIAGELVCFHALSKALAPWLIRDEKPDTVVLGCTHFPLITAELEQLMPGTNWVDSGEAIARRVFSLLSAQQAVDVKGLQTGRGTFNPVFYTQQSAEIKKLTLPLYKMGLGPMKLI